MRAPADTFRGTYGEHDWREIAKTVADGLGLDADRVTISTASAYVKVRPGGDLPTRPRTARPTTTLRAAIEAIAIQALARPTSPGASVEQLRELQAQTDALDLAHISSQIREMARHARPARDIARSNRYNARRSYALLALCTLWTDLGGEATGKATYKFLAACMIPVLGEAETGNVRRWVEDYFQGKGHRFHY